MSTSAVADAQSSDPDVEPEVELSGSWTAVRTGWWLLVLGFILGAVVGYLVSLGGGKVFEAKATVYLGQPLNANSSAQVQGVGSNPAVVNQIIKSTSTINSVASKVGVPPGKLRRGVTSSAVQAATASAKTGQTTLVTITVRGPWKRQAADAANLLAASVVDQVSGYADAKIALLQGQSAAQQQQLQSLDEQIAKYQQAATDQSLTPAERLAAVGLLNSAIVERGDLATAKTETDLQLSLAQNVERGQVVTHAAATSVAARSRRSSTIVGAVIGLLLGLAVALLWKPPRLRSRRAKPPAPQSSPTEASGTDR